MRKTARSFNGGIFLKKRRIILGVFCAVAAVALFFFLKVTFSGELIVDPIIVTIGPFSVRWYGVLIATGIVLAYILGRNFALKEGIKEDYLVEMVFWGIIAGIIGARLYYVAFNFDYYRDNPMEIFKIWNGGLAIHGAFFGGLFAGFLYTRLKKSAGIRFFQASDIFTAVLPLAQAIGRWGNFMNHEAYGAPTDLPWKMFVPRGYRVPGYTQYKYFHPTFLYESLWDIFVFIVLFNYMKKRKRYGEVTGLYMILYSMGRFVIEGLRLDSLYVGELRTAKLVSVILMIVGLIIFFHARYRGEEVRRVS